MKTQLNEAQKLQKTAGILQESINEAKLKIGNDGYGGKNITVSKNKYGIFIEKKDPHDYGRGTEISIPLSDVPALVRFLSSI